MEESGTADAMEGGWETASIVAVVVDVDVGAMKVVVEGQEGCMLDVCVVLIIIEYNRGYHEFCVSDRPTDRSPGFLLPP